MVSRGSCRASTISCELTVMVLGRLEMRFRRNLHNHILFTTADPMFIFILSAVLSLYEQVIVLAHI